MDNVFIERLWRSVKYEEIYLREHSTLAALRAGLEGWFKRYNSWRPHEALGNLTPDAVYKMPPRSMHKDPVDFRRNQAGRGARSSSGSNFLHPSLQAPHATLLRSVACYAFRYGCKEFTTHLTQQLKP